MAVDLGNQQSLEGLSVFGDDQDPAKFYVMPDQPRFRIDSQTGKPVFKFIKYKLPVDRPDGKKGGGFVVFDTQFVVADATLKKIQSDLDAQVAAKNIQGVTSATIDHIPFTDATASLTLLDTSGVLVSKVDTPAKPSVFGSMICPFTAELTPEGATVIEAAMSGSGGVAQVSYDLHFPATFPPITGTIVFNASKFYSFYQSIQKSDDNWVGNPQNETEDTQQQFINSSSGNVSFDFSSLGNLDADTQKKVHDAIENWGWGQVQEAAKAIAALPDIKPTDDTGDDGMNSITKYQSTFEATSFVRTVSEREGVSFETNQGGTLPNLVDMGFKWSDYCVEVDANDPFFAQISASITVNADFAKYGIATVNAHAEYDKTNPITSKDQTFTGPDTIFKFDSDTANGDMHYVYSFQVNYKDQNQSYQSAPFTTDSTAITINANDLGLLYAVFTIGNVDFTKTPKVQVSVTYPENDASGNPISQQFNFDQGTTAPQTFLAVILKAVDQPYTYTVTYILADGSQVNMSPVSTNASQVFINSPFVQHTFSFLAEGDFVNGIDTIVLKFAYDDATNNVHQSSDYTFNAQSREFDWKIPIVAGGKGQVSYSGVISYKNHTTENFTGQPTTNDLIEFGPPNQVIVTVLPDTTLIDFSKVKMIILNLEYVDAAHGLDIKQEYKLLSNTNIQPWTFYARDPTKTSYTWSATYYMAPVPPATTPTEQTTAPAPSSDANLVLMMPS
jgi:hypothetical protein